MTDDILTELAAIEAASAADMTTAPPAVPVHMPEPVPGSTHNVTLNIDGSPVISPTEQGTIVERQLNPYQETPPVAAPVPAPQPEPAPAAAPTPSPEPPPAPGSPEVRIPESTPRRVYAHPGMTEENKLLLGLLDANPSLSPDAIFAALNTQLGRTTPAPIAPAPTAAPAPEPIPADAVTFDSVNQRLDEIDRELESLDNVVDATKWQKLTLEHNRLTRQLPALQVQQVQQQLTADQQIDAAIAETRNAVSQAYPQITPEVFAIIEDPSKPVTLIADPFAQAFAVRYRQDQAAQSPLLEAADYESLVAASIAQRLGVLPTHAQRAPAAPVPGAPAPTPAAAPVQRPAPQPQPQPGLVPVAGMPAISGALHTNADRVTTTPVNPAANVQIEYQQALAAGDFEAAERLSAVMATGGNTPQQALAGLNISYSGG